MENINEIYKILLEMKEQQGEMHAGIKALNDKVAIQNGRIVKAESKIQKFEVSYGKIGVILGAANFVLVFAFNFILNWAEKKFDGK